jgi:hypothetical protein
MSRRRYRRGRRGGLSSTVDDAAHIAAKFGPVGALWTGAIGFAVFYAALPACMLAWTAERKASLKGPTAAALARVLEQVLWQRFISPCQWAGVAILLVCVAIAIWKHLDRGDLDSADVTFLSAASKLVSRLVGH